ncbi:MAG: site-specific DNA-methyltransferase [Mariniphaga sp.]|nr:site-specific DNA-methyltransferase [Mariniphaga sp.]
MPTLNFKGKSFVQNHHLAVPFHQLVPQKEKSLTDKLSLHDNLIIQGDNLKALKALLPTYSGKIKCIYIDPPYNTGNEGWAYNDNVNSPMIKDWLGKVVDKDDLTRHDKWLCMMMPRLKLLRELLSEDGVIFISIDDTEQHRIRVLLDEIFGEKNFISNIIWEKADSPKMDADYFSTSHDNTLMYAKNEEFYSINRLILDEKDLKHYTKIDEKGRKFYLKPLRAMGGQGETRESRPALYYSLLAPDNTEVFPKLKDGGDGAWRWSSKKVEKEKDRIEWIQGKSGWTPYFRIYAENSKGRPPMTIWYNRDVGSNRTSKNEVNEIFNDTNAFNTPKPLKLLKRIIKISTSKNDIILDSFAGSGTTAHAVLDLNKEDGGNRKFILVEMEDYADSITAERVRRVIKGVSGSKKFKEGTGGTFSYFELGPAIEMESILQGESLPAYGEIAKYLFYTATGEEFDPLRINEETNYIGASRDYEIYLFYKPDLNYLKSTALTLEKAKALGRHNGKKRLVFAPAKFVDNHTLTELRIEFCQLPFEIYKLKG